MKIEFVVPGEHSTYPHHFADETLVPGYLLLECITTALAQAGMARRHIKRAKFLHPVRPGEQGELVVADKGARVDVDLMIEGERRLRLALI